MKSPGLLQESVERFRLGFWNGLSTGRPPVGVAPGDLWLPIKYLRKAPDSVEVSPGDLNFAGILNEYDFVFRRKAIRSDDLLPFAAPWRAIPWLEALCGCPVRYSAGSLAPQPRVPSSGELREIPLPASPAWQERMLEQLEDLGRNLPGDCWISPTILRGPSDVLAALRGLKSFFYDLYDDPGAVRHAAARINRLLIRVLQAHFSRVSPKMGGYGHIFGYWAPGRTIAIQEDVLGMCSPATYRDLFLELNQEIVDTLGPCVFFHLHSTGYGHFEDVLSLRGLAGLQITVEQNGPSLKDLLPDLRKISERTRLILFAEHHCDQLKDCVNQLPRAGLYLILPDSLVSTEEEYRELIQALF